MVTAIVLLTAEKSRVNEVAEEIALIREISEVYSITGHYDIAAVVRAADNDSLANVITSRVLKIEGITKSETMFAFRVFSRYDLERIFSIGTE
jgi:DNA-binding Lrp family transcriptional regulator